MNFLTPIGGVQPINVVVIIANLVVTGVLSALIATVYKRTHRGLSYSQSFVFTLVLASIIVAMVMMVIGNSIALAFGLLGAFSIIRFRTPVKDTKDTIYLFFAITVGMAVGTRNYAIALIGTALILLIIWILTKTNFGSIRKHEFLLSFTALHAGDAGNQYESIFKKYLKNSLLLNITSRKDGSASEYAYQVSLLDENKSSDLVAELSALNGIQEVHLITSREDVEY